MIQITTIMLFLVDEFLDMQQLRGQVLGDQQKSGFTYTAERVISAAGI